MVIGVTGGIGCGKSTIAEYFATCGWYKIDADDICHQLYAEREPRFYSAIKRRWGKQIINLSGEADRRAIAGIVFNDCHELSWLNQQLHPLIYNKAAGMIEKYRCDCNIVFEAALLFEAAWEPLVDRTLTVWSDSETVISRLQARGLTLDDIKRRQYYQLPPDEKLERADIAIINNGTNDNLFRQCDLIKQRLNCRPFCASCC